MSDLRAIAEAAGWHGLRYVEAGDCWEWAGARNPRRGYGETHVKDDGSWPKRGAHRVVWSLINGPIPAGLVVMHTCDNPPCVNPAHLRLGTIADNQRDMAEKGRAANQYTHNPPTSCRSGHAYAEVGVYVDRRGTRHCRECGRARWRESDRRRRERVA